MIRSVVLPAFSLALCLCDLSACGAAKTSPHSPIPTPHLPVTVEGVVFQSTNFGDWTETQRKVGFRNMEYIRPTRMVFRGRTSVALPRAPVDLSAFRYEFNGRVQSIDDFMREMHVAGLLVLQDGRVVLERYAEGHSPSSAWTSFSVAKSVLSMLFGAAVGDGSIRSLDDSVTHYVQALRGSAYDGVTLRHLLQMSSGISWNEDYDDPRSDVNQFPVDQGMDGLLSYMKRLPRRAPPGTVFNYSTAETDIAGAVLRSATGRPLAQYLAEKIWKPAGMEGNAYWVTLREGDLERGGCCLSATLRDFGRLGLLALNDGVAMDGTRLLPAGWMATATTAAPTNPGYGFLWWLSSPPGRSWATGIYGQNIYLDPSRKVVIAIHSFWDRATTPELVAHRKAFREALAAAVAPNGMGTR